MMPHHGGNGLLIIVNLKWLIKRVFDICRGKIFHVLLNIDFSLGFQLLFYFYTIYACMCHSESTDLWFWKREKVFYMPQQFSLYINDFFPDTSCGRINFHFYRYYFLLPLSYVNRERNSSCILYCLCELFWRWYSLFRLTLSLRKL